MCHIAMSDRNMTETSCDTRVFPDVTSVLQNLKLESLKVEESRYPKWTGERLPHATFASVRDPVFERVDSNILRRLTVLESLMAQILQNTINIGNVVHSDDAQPPVGDAGPDLNSSVSNPVSSDINAPVCQGKQPRVYRKRKNKRGPRKAAELTTDDGVVCVD